MPLELQKIMPDYSFDESPYFIDENGAVIDEFDFFLDKPYFCRITTGLKQPLDK